MNRDPIYTILGRQRDDDDQNKLLQINGIVKIIRRILSIVWIEYSNDNIRRIIFTNHLFEGVCFGRRRRVAVLKSLGLYSLYNGIEVEDMGFMVGKRRKVLLNPV
jgi:hypothetical protein